MKSSANPSVLSRVVIKGYKSIPNCDLSLNSINIFIGPNGAGKSNFIGFFKMIKRMLEGTFQTFVGQQGGPDALLYFGRKRTSRLEAELYFGENGYFFSLGPTIDNKLIFLDEAFWWKPSGKYTLGSGHYESNVYKGTKTRIDDYVLTAMRQWRVYHFHDTGDSALVKRPGPINDNAYLRPNAENLAAYLYHLQKKYPQNYEKIVKIIQLAAPFFGDFHLRPSPDNADIIELEWVQKGADIPFKAHYLSDGTLRFICLATVFLQPDELQPATIMVDEPELGLHPYAIELLTSLIKSVSNKHQLILATQSVDFLNHFNPEDIIVANGTKEGSQFKRLNKQELSGWLEDDTLGGLWRRNFFGGNPST